MKSVRICLFVLLFVFLLGTAGCGEQDLAEGACLLYYLNIENTKIIPQSYEAVSDTQDTDAMIKELLLQLMTDSGDVEYQKPIPSDVTVENYVLEETLLTLYFNEAYLNMDKVTEVLTRAAIVRTLTQVPGVECLVFYIADAPLADRHGNPIGVMTNDTFVENPGEQINSIQAATLTLYFANQEGNALVSESQDVHYSSNISMEKLVMEHLLAGPSGKDAQTAIPEGTKLLNVSVLEGVCYVSLDETFLNQNYNIEEPIVLYSIINSLSEISTINKVQISVNGDTNGVYRDAFPLNELYERNLDYVKE